MVGSCCCGSSHAVSPAAHSSVATAASSSRGLRRQAAAAARSAPAALPCSTAVSISLAGLVCWEAGRRAGRPGAGEVGPPSRRSGSNGCCIAGGIRPSLSPRRGQSAAILQHSGDAHKMARGIQFPCLLPANWGAAAPATGRDHRPTGRVMPPEHRWNGGPGAWARAKAKLQAHMWPSSPLLAQRLPERAALRTHLIVVSGCM